MRHGSSVQRVVQSEKIRFGLVGAFNTAVDFSILFVLARLVGIPTVVANIISTSCALAVSYLLNKKAVFRDTDKNNHRQVVLFVVVTLVGLWGVQSVVMLGVSELLHSMLPALGDGTLALVIKKAVATLVSLIWNYLWYSRVVFRKGSHEKTL